MHVSHKYESFKNAMKSDFSDRNFQIFNQISQMFIRLSLKSNFQSNDMFIMHISSLEFEISKMF